LSIKELLILQKHFPYSEIDADDPKSNHDGKRKSKMQAECSPKGRPNAGQNAGRMQAKIEQVNSVKQQVNSAKQSVNDFRR
jgi:hypothetical protein